MASMSVEGGTELAVIEAQLRAAEKRIGEKGSQVVRNSTLAGEAVCKQLAAVDTGAMRASVSHDLSGDAASGVIEGEWGPTVRYAPFLERGTSRMAPQPFVLPSLDAVTPGFIAAAEAISDPLD